MANPKIKIVVEVRGGVAEVFCDAPSLVDVFIVDHDNLDDEDYEPDDDAEEAAFEDGTLVRDMMENDEMFSVA